MPEWVTPIIGLVGVFIGVGITEFRLWRESEERYRIITFEKRLVIHQEALSNCYRVYHHIFSRKTQEKKNTAINEMENWWENNCLLLDEKSRRKTLDFIGDARDYANKITESQSEFMRTNREALNAISQGIGIKHLKENPTLDREEKTLQG